METRRTLGSTEASELLLEARSIGLRPGRTVIAGHLGLTDRQTRTEIQHLEDLGLIRTGSFEGLLRGHSVELETSNPWLLRRTVVDWEAR